MSWGGIDLIARRGGEAPQDAVDRVYAGGLQITVADGVPVVQQIPQTPDADGEPERTGADRTLEAIELLEAQMPGWNTDPSTGEAEPEDFDGLVAEHPEAPFWALITAEHVTLNRVRSGPPAEGDWPLWWQTVQRFAAAGWAVFHPDTSELLDASLTAEEADARYALM